MKRAWVMLGAGLLWMAACGEDETTTTTTGPATVASSASSGSGGATTTAAVGGMGGTGGMATGGGGSGGSGPLALSSPAFMEGENIPVVHECGQCGNGGMQISPQLDWIPGPSGTLSYAIVLRDLDYMNGFVHWAIWDIPANTTSLPEGVDVSPMPSNVMGASQSATGYRGPCSCGPVNTYEFTVYALDVATLGVAAGTDRATAAAAIDAANALATATLSGES